MTINDILHILEGWFRNGIIDISNYHGFHDASWIRSTEALVLASIFSIISLVFSFTHIYRHLRLFTMPQIQVYVIRVLVTCPVYAILSAIALLSGQRAVYAEIIRDLYEAVVVYAFFNLILEYGGGETDCVYAIENDRALTLPFPFCFMKRKERDTRLIRFCHRGVLQFIITKPIMTFANIILLLSGYYYNPIWQTFEVVIYNISYIWALYCLYVFYLATKKVIYQFKPIAKFAAVKGVVFATYYQSLILRLTLSKPDTALEWNDFLLCFEMIFVSIAFMFAFPINEFMGGIPNRRVFQNAKEVFTVKDIVQNISINFTPTYEDYALQRSENEVPKSIHVNARMKGNMNSVALEMTQRYRGYSSKKSFNSVLRGSNPIQSKIRRNRDQYLTEENVIEETKNTISDDNELIQDEELGIDAESATITTTNPEAFHLGKLSLQLKKTTKAPSSYQMIKNSESSERLVNKSEIKHSDSTVSNEEYDESTNPIFENSSTICESSVSPCETILSSSPKNEQDTNKHSKIEFSSPPVKVRTSLDDLASPSFEWSEFV